MGMLLIGSSVLKARFRHDCRCCNLLVMGGETAGQEAAGRWRGGCRQARGELKATGAITIGGVAV